MPQSDAVDQPVDPLVAWIAKQPDIKHLSLSPSLRGPRVRDDLSNRFGIAGYHHQKHARGRIGPA